MGLAPSDPKRAQKMPPVYKAVYKATISAPLVIET
jgi:hypothetical protein